MNVNDLYQCQCPGCETVRLRLGLEPTRWDLKPVKTLIGNEPTVFHLESLTWCLDFPGIKNPPPSAGDIRDASSSPGSGRSPEVGNGNPLQYSCLENPMDRGACWATVHGVTKSQTRLRLLSTHVASADLLRLRFFVSQRRMNSKRGKVTGK